GHRKAVQCKKCRTERGERAYGQQKDRAHRERAEGRQRRCAKSDAVRHEADGELAGDSDCHRVPEAARRGSVTEAEIREVPDQVDLTTQIARVEKEQHAGKQGEVRCRTPHGLLEALRVRLRLRLAPPSYSTWH